MSSCLFAFQALFHASHPQLLGQTALSLALSPQAV